MILKTDSIEKLVAALSKAQAAFGVPKKTKEVSVRSDKATYTYKYADLAEIMNAITPALSANELALVATIDAETNVLTTLLLHSSGQYIGTTYALPRGLPAQAFGSALTYARRYSVTALVQIVAEEDDDANSVQGLTDRQIKNARRQTPPAAGGSPIKPKPQQVINGTSGPKLQECPKNIRRDDLLQGIKSLYLPYMNLHPNADPASIMMERYGAQKITELQDNEAFDFHRFLESEINKGVAV